ncbi:MAG: S9 family peptidase [Ignavibacteriae bacterium]|nr:S9 family peptidase [Ignavibacteriota bacterium]
MLISREKILLKDMQLKILKSAWGETSVNSVVERITYLSDGLKVHGYLAYPKNLTNKYPCVIWNRGGFGNAGALDDFYAQGILGQIASWGYVVFETQYRGNVGGEGKDEFGGDDLNDIFNLIPLANELEFADENIWGIEGWSRGGMMTYLTLTKPNNFKVAITSGGITNLNCTKDESNFMKNLLNHYGNNLSEDHCFQRSIINYADKIKKDVPMLILHGLNDNRIPPHHSLDLSSKLIENKIKHRLVLLEDGDHFLKNHKIEIDKLRKMWFEKYLI